MSFVAKQKAFVSQPFEMLHKFGWTMTIWSRLVNADMHESFLSGEQSQFRLQITADTQLYLGQFIYEMLCILVP